MKTTIEKNRIFFSEGNKAFANITVNERNKSVYFELLKVVPKYRNCHLATKLMIKILTFIKEKGYHSISLSPLPLDLSGPNLEELILFYKKFGFDLSENRNTTYPYLMSIYL